MIQFCKKPFFSIYLFFLLKLRLPIVANLIYIFLKVYYIFEKPLPVDVWVKDKPFQFLYREIFYYYYYISLY